MRAMKTSTIRRLMLGALFGAAAALAVGAPAHADEGTEQPGGLLGTVVEVVDEVLPNADPKPSEEPAEPDAPADEPGQTTEPAGGEQPETSPTDPIGEVVDEVVDDVTDTAEEIVEVITTPLPAPVVTLPPAAAVLTPTPAATQPTPATTATTPTAEATTETVTPELPAAEPAPVDLPVVIGPVAGTATLLPGLPPAPVGTEQPDRGPLCTSDRDDQAAPDHGRGAVRTITDRRSGLPTAERKPAPLKPCPTPAGPDGQAVTAGNVKPPPPTGEQLVALTIGGTYSAPVLHRLAQLRPRGDIPASRTEHPEPGPA